MNLTGQTAYQKGTKRRRERKQEVREDDEFLAWVRLQPSCISGAFSEFVDGTGRCVAAHVRRASKAGVALKPLFSAVPLTDAEHKLTHQKGEDVLRPKAWWDSQAKLYLVRWKRARRFGELT